MFAVRFRGGKIYQSTISHEHCLTVAEIEGEKLPRKSATFGMIGKDGEFVETDKDLIKAQRDFNERMSFVIKPPEEIKPKRKRPNLFRQLLAIPFIVIGASVLMLAELIQGDKLTFIGRDAIKRLSVNAECMKCGHKGTLRILK